MYIEIRTPESEFVAICLAIAYYRNHSKLAIPIKKLKEAKNAKTKYQTETFDSYT